MIERGRGEVFYGETPDGPWTHIGYTDSGMVTDLRPAIRRAAGAAQRMGEAMRAFSEGITMSATATRQATAALREDKPPTWCGEHGRGAMRARREEKRDQARRRQAAYDQAHGKPAAEKGN